MNLALWCRVRFLPPEAGRPTDTASKPRWTMREGRRCPRIYGALRVRDGKEHTRCAPARHSKEYIALLADIEAANPKGDLDRKSVV